MKNTLILLLYLCSGVVVGSLVCELVSDISWLSWLTYGQSFGITSPLVLDLSALQITFGLKFKLNIAVILFIALAGYIYSRTVRTGRRK